MSEEVTGVTLQVTEKAVSTGLNAATRIAEMAARLFRELMAMSREHNAGRMKNNTGSKEKVRETDLADLKPGYADYKDLVKSAQKRGDALFRRCCISAYIHRCCRGSGSATADTAYQNVVNFFLVWIRRVGALVALIGGIMFGLSVKSNDSEQKQAGILTMVAGFIVFAIALGADMFDLFT